MTPVGTESDDQKKQKGLGAYGGKIESRQGPEKFFLCVFIIFALKSMKH